MGTSKQIVAHQKNSDLVFFVVAEPWGLQKDSNTSRRIVIPSSKMAKIFGWKFPAPRRSAPKEYIHKNIKTRDSGRHMLRKKISNTSKNSISLLLLKYNYVF